MNNENIQNNKLRTYVFVYMLQAIPYVTVYFLLAFLKNDLNIFKFSIISLPCIIVGYLSYFYINYKNNRNVSLIFFVISILWGATTGVIFLTWSHIALILLFDVIFCIGIYFIENNKIIRVFTVTMFLIHLIASSYMVIANRTMTLDTSEVFITIFTCNSATILLWYLINAGKHQMQTLATLKAEDQAQIEAFQNINNRSQHEFRNRLAPAFALVSLLTYIDDVDKGAQKDFILEMMDDILDLAKQAKVSIDSIEKMLSSMLYASRINAKSMHIDMKIINFAELVKKQIKSFEYSLSTKMIKIELNIYGDESEYISWFDENAITSIIDNLLENAIKYTERDRSVIKISLRIDKNNIIFNIIDQGIGIPKDKLESITDKFMRAYEREPIKGFGLGLSIVKEYCDLHQARLRFDSTESIGTEFTIEFNRLPIPETDKKYDTLILEDNFTTHLEFISDRDDIIHTINNSFAIAQMRLHPELKNFVIDININNEDRGLDIIDEINKLFDNPRIIIHSMYNRKEFPKDYKSIKNILIYKKTNKSIEQIRTIL